ncbi:MAG: NAD(P)H-quinone oxidoreductase subunit 5 [Idiomarinaceae bacterium HL-53]|nr:MAG: NAD(P)H-quinone oxidoreductase subunit 5 [Idiomarinaceae bacterium HL-53]CUS49563.1 NAD(P)H-quinone oxidoreductase subunit 5 [Idiomarinaceae bacterium HL-53]
MTDLFASLILWFAPVILVWAARQKKPSRLPIVLVGICLIFAGVAHMAIEGSATEHVLLALTPLRFLILGMIVLVAWAVVNYSKQALREEANAASYWRWLFATLAAVVLVVSSNHLLLLWLSWVAISLSLHKLLMFYPERPRARLAAHKKFIIARTAEICLLIGFVLLGEHFETYYLSEILLTWEPMFAEQTVVQVSAVLIAVTALLKCAQLPVHGWLIQVVEAPTPVSALLHAGVVNLGGFLLLITAPIVLAVPAAVWLVLIVAGLTAVLSALIMITRVSVKVRLAWSTSAQMGMMLVEIALGLYELAVVHLIAHSIYKAYAFLSAGNAVHDTLQRRLAQAGQVQPHDWAVSLVLSAALVGLGAWAYQELAVVWFDKQVTSLLSVLLLFWAAMTMLLAQRHSMAAKGGLMSFSALAAALVFSYYGLKSLAQFVIPSAYVPVAGMFSLPDLWVSALVVLLVTASLLMHNLPQLRISQKLSMVLFAGLYLDEWATRATLTIWPIYPRAKPQSIHAMSAAQSTSELKEKSHASN